jgi:alpha-beta hydrolase superfamily lysophospholipase
LAALLSSALTTVAIPSANAEPKHAAHAGRYKAEADCEWVVTATAKRLWLRNTCTQAWRGFERQGEDWRAGHTSLTESVNAKSAGFKLRLNETPAGKRLELSEPGKPVQVALAAARYTVAPTEFNGPAGRLSGQFYWPDKPSGAVTVMVHGSGPQDRHGYASIIAVLADALAVQGHVVLAYDKRGSGQSQGDGDTASFADLAGDAQAAWQHAAHAARASGLEASRVGFAGSSQAGWVIAKAIAAGSAPAHVLLLGAAGAAVDVQTQNNFYTQTRMRCEGHPRERVASVLAQHAAFYAHLRQRTAASADALRTATANVPWRARAWAMPDRIDFAAPGRDWFRVLELDFDPLPVWQAYRGEAVLIFAEHDDATPTEAAIQRLQSLGLPHLRLHKLAGAQHLGLVAESACKGDLTQVSRFSPALWGAFRVAR